jgi:hypothetical protein
MFRSVAHVRFGFGSKDPLLAVSNLKDTSPYSNTHGCSTSEHGVIRRCDLERHYQSVHADVGMLMLACPASACPPSASPAGAQSSSKASAVSSSPASRGQQLFESGERRQEVLKRMPRLALKQRTIVNVSPHPTLVSSSTTPVSLTSPTLRSPSTPNTGGNGGGAASSPALSAAHESLQSASLNESYAIDLTPTSYSVHVNGRGEEAEGGRETAACSCVRHLMRPVFGGATRTLVCPRIDR